MRSVLPAILMLLFATTALAADSIPSNPIPTGKGYINRWLVLGPFATQPADKPTKGGISREGFETDYLATLGGEGKAVLSADTRVSGGSETLAPKPAEASASGWISIDEMYEDFDTKAAYAFCNAVADADGEYYGHIQTSDALRVWVDGALVVDAFSKDTEDVSRVKHFVVTLKKGPNPVLVKDGTGAGSWAFRLELYTRGDEEKRFALVSQDLAVTVDRTEVALADGSISASVEFQPHTLLHKPEAALMLSSPDGKDLASAKVLMGDSATLAIPAGYEGLLILTAKLADYNGRSFSGTAKTWRGDMETARTDLLKRIAALKAGAPTMPDAAWHRHKNVALYYERTMQNARSTDKAAFALFRAREGSLLEVLTDARAVVDAMEKGNDIFASRTGAFRAAYVSPADDSVQIYTAYVPADYDESRAWPLVVQLHGYSAWANNPSFVTFKGESLSVRVDERGGGNSYTNLAERDVLDVIAEMRRLYNVDSSRIYIVGNSMGGYGTWRLASRHPDLFAAAIPFCGFTGGLPLENLANVAVWACHDVQDPVVAFAQTQVAVELLRGWGYPVRLYASTGFGHSAEQGLRASGQDPLDWLLAQRRPDAPQRIVYTCDSNGDRKAYWVEIADFAYQSMPARVKALAAAGNNLYLELDNVAVLALNLPAPLFDKAAPLVVNIAGSALRREAPLPDTLYVRRKLDGWELADSNPVAPSSPRPYVSGSVSNLYQGEPLLVVYGTTGSDDCLEAMSRFAREMSTYTISREPMDISSIPVKRDTDVTDDDIRTRNLVLIGGPSQNAITKRIADKLPAVEQGGKIVLGKLEYDLKGRGYTLFHYNPAAPDRLVYIVASDVPDFYSLRNSAIALALDLGASLDFTLSDVTERRVVRHIAWSKEWQPAQRFLASQPLPDVFKTGPSLWKAMRASMLRSSGADFIIGASDSEPDVANGAFDVTAATWADFDLCHYEPDLLAFDLPGEDVLRLAGALGSSGRFSMMPEVKPAEISPARSYRVAIPQWTYFAVAGVLRRNFDSIRRVDSDWYSDFRRTLGAK